MAYPSIFDKPKNDFNISGVLNQQSQLAGAGTQIGSYDQFSQQFALGGNGLNPTAGLSPILPDIGAPAYQPTLAERAFGYTAKDGSSMGGFALPALQVANAGMQTYLGLKQLGVAEDSLSFQKDAFSKQFETQKQMTNTQLRDRQTRRLEASGGPGHGVMGVDEYMRLNGI